MESIDSLRNKISEENDLILFDEVKSCIDTGAYRSAYIMTWISIAESIRSKITSMSYRDHDAQKRLDDLDENENNDFPIDFKLIEYALYLGYLDKDEFQKMDHIRKMRNSYAHPSGKAPNRDEVVCALNIAVDVVLSKPPLLRHGYVQKTIEFIFNDYNYFDDDSSIVKKHAENFVNRIHPTVLDFSLMKLLEQFDLMYDDDEKKIYRQRGVIFGTEIIKTILKRELQDNNDLNHYLDEHQTSSSLLYVNLDIWDNLPHQEKNRAFGYLTDKIHSDKLIWCRNYILKKLYTLYESSKLTNRQDDKFKSILESFSYSSLISIGMPLSYYVERIISDLESHSWGEQNVAADALLEIDKTELGLINNEFQEQLGRNILQAADGNSWQSQLLLSSLLNENKEYPIKFIYGIIAETLINDEAQFRLKRRFFKKSIKILLNHPQKNIIFNNLNNQMKNSELKNKADKLSFKKALNVLNTLKNESNNNEIIIKLINTIKSLELKIEY